MAEMNEQKIKRFGDKLAKSNDVLAHVITVWFADGNIENNWSGVRTEQQAPQLSIVSMDDEPDE